MERIITQNETMLVKTNYFFLERTIESIDLSAQTPNHFSDL